MPKSLSPQVKGCGKVTQNAAKRSTFSISIKTYKLFDILSQFLIRFFIEDELALGDFIAVDRQTAFLVLG